MISQRAAGGGKQYGVPYGMGLRDARRTQQQVAEAVIPALKDKSIEVLFFTFRTLKMRQIGGRYSDYGIAAIFVNIRVQKSKIRYKLACKRICDFGTLMLNKICEFGWHHEQFVPDMM